MKKFLSFAILLISLNLVTAYEWLPNGSVVEVEDQLVTKSKLYPNPAADFTIINNTSNTKIKNISVLSMVGSSMINKEISDNNTSQEINVSRLPSGRYFVRISYIDGSQEILTLIKL